MNRVKKVELLLHREALFRLYSSIFHSHLCYCAELWGSCSNVYLFANYQRTKTKVSKYFVICKNRDHTSTFLKGLSILKFPDFVEYKISVLMFKAWDANLTENLQCLFQSNSKNKHTTQLLNFKVKSSKSKTKSNCLSIIDVRL